MFSMQETARTVVLIFAIAALGYAVGAVKLKGISLGSSAIFLVALVFGHFGVTFPAAMQTGSTEGCPVSGALSSAESLRRYAAGYAWIRRSSTSAISLTRR